MLSSFLASWLPGLPAILQEYGIELGKYSLDLG
jgi:hypothetical protein